MTVMFGDYALSGAMLTAMCVVLAAAGYLRTNNDGFVRCTRWGTGLIAVLLSISAWGLVKALMDDNFALSYVVQHSERSLSVMYKVAAFWAGQEGSLLLWAWLVAVMGVVVAILGRRRNDAETAITLGFVAAVAGFFACVMVFAGNPFAPATAAGMDGEGLNPLLQNFAMVAHPPLLFVGYAGYTIPFALMLGALITGKQESDWLKKARPWIIFSWVALTVGILLGAQWAYVELGWGGYWAWDPVENASLLPWLTGTALIHSALLQTRRGIFKRWTVCLVAASFFLCVLGTYLTRSGVIQSVHAFEASSIGRFFLVFLVVIGLASIGTILARLSLLRADRPLTNLVSKDGLFLGGIVLLVLMTAATLVGTVYPILSGATSETPITVGPAFYNSVVLPLALVLAVLMGLAPILGNGDGAASKARGKLIAVGIAGVVCGAMTAWSGHGAAWAIGAAATAGVVVTAFVINLVATVKGTMAAGTSVVRAFTGRPNHWGAQLAHVGLAALIVGVAGSSVYNVKQNVELKTGSAGTQKVAVGNYTVALHGVEQVRRENHSAAVATLDVTDGKGRAFQLKPERRFYDRGMEEGQSASEVAIRFGLGEDLYVTLAGWDDQLVTVQVIVNPLVNWIWIGGGLLVVGGLLSLIGLAQRAAVAASDMTKAPPVRRNAVQTARDRRRAKGVPMAANTGVSGRQM